MREIEITLNGEKRKIAEPATIASLLETLGLAERRVAVLRNGEVVRRAEFEATDLSEGDSIDIIHMVGGG